MQNLLRQDEIVTLHQEMMGCAMWGRLDEHSPLRGNWVNSPPKIRKAETCWSQLKQGW